MLRVAIVEDSEQDRDVLVSFLKRYTMEKGEIFQTTCFSNGLNFIEDYKPEFDLTFMDIEMPHMDGLKAAHRLREMDQDTSLIFVTNMAQYAINGYEVAALNFLLKPLQYFRFSVELDKVVRNSAVKNAAPIILAAKEGQVRLKYESVYYVDSDKHYLCFHTSLGDYHVRGKLNEWDEKLLEHGFCRSGTSFLINLMHVSLIKNSSAVVNGEEIPISRSKKKEFSESFTKYLGGMGYAR